MPIVKIGDTYVLCAGVAKTAPSERVPAAARLPAPDGPMQRLQNVEDNLARTNHRLEQVLEQLVASAGKPAQASKKD